MLFGAYRSWFRLVFEIVLIILSNHGSRWRSYCLLGPDVRKELGLEAPERLSFFVKSLRGESIVLYQMGSLSITRTLLRCYSGQQGQRG